MSASPRRTPQRHRYVYNTSPARERIVLEGARTPKQKRKARRAAGLSDPANRGA
jgi:hypothetical protein